MRLNPADTRVDISWGYPVVSPHASFHRISPYLQKAWGLRTILRVRISITDQGSATDPCRYIKFLPAELLPTFWNESERQLLTGTTLQPALEAKLKSLFREFELVRASTEQIAWCRELWWDEIEGVVDEDDWKQCDAMYRSRALEFPGIGDSMVAGIDMANHASGDRTIALYEVNEDGDAALLLQDNKKLGTGDEITITYGDNKGACEMLFSYGFIEDSMTTARELFLNLEIPDDDPLKRAKNAVSTVAPGVRLYESGVSTSWDSDYVWLICVNEEDGFEFRIAQSNDGTQELQVFWKEDALHDVSQLHRRLQNDEMWAVFQLRAVATIQARVEWQLSVLLETEDGIGRTAHGEGTNIRSKPYAQAMRLRKLETKLLQQCYADLEEEVSNNVLYSDLLWSPRSSIG
jgi:hypothetical protein